MTKATVSLAALLLVLCVPVSPCPQADLQFERLSLEQGVAHDLVFCMLQDRTGFMWFGTMYGLVRYDGRRYTVFKHDPADSNSISFNDVISIHEDRAGHLWIGTWGGGLNRFDPATEKFTRFLHDAQDTTSLHDNMVWAVGEDRTGNFWVGTQTGLDQLIIDDAGRSTITPRAKFLRYPLPFRGTARAMKNSIRALLLDQGGRLWIGTGNDGLFCLTSANGQKQIQHYRHQADDPASLSDNEVTSIYQDQKGEVWIGTGMGLNRMTPGSRPAAATAFQHYRHEPQNDSSLSHNRIGPIGEDAEGALWIGTARGLNRLDRNQKSFTRFQHHPADPHSLRTPSIVALCRDRSGLMWIATYFGGVHKLDTRGTPFRHVRHEPGKEASLSAGAVRAIHQDRDGRLWIGTFGGGLNVLETKSNSSAVARTRAPGEEFVHFRFGSQHPPRLPSNLITALTSDSLGRIWVGAQNGGLTQIEASRRVTTYRHDPADSTSLSSDNVQCLYLDRSEDLWIGTDNGLSRMTRDDRGRRHFIRYRHSPHQPQSLSDNFVHTICEDRFGALWLGTYRGLDRFDRQTQTFRHYRHDLREARSLSNEYVYAMHEDQAGNLWVGTSDGLNLFDRATETFTTFKENAGLPNGVICAILEDRGGRLWLSTNKGLSCFDPKARAFRNYDVDDGLQSNMFSPGARCKSQEGLLYFGGINGYNCFRPEAIRPNEFKPPVVLTTVRIFDKPLLPAQYTAAPLVLPYEQNFLSFEFAALIFAQPGKNQYAYQLAGVDRDWVYAGTKNFASYANVQPGQYAFRVKAANHDGVWNEQETALAIVITPPFWRTWWFSSLAAAIAIWSAIYWHHRRMQHERKRLAEIESIKSAESIKRFQEVEQARLQEREAVRKQIAADFHDASGHKLTKISLFCGVLQSKLRAGAAEIDDYLERIMKAAASLHQDLSDFIWSLDPAENTLHDIALKLKEFGDKLFDHSGIRFDMPVLAPELEQTALPMEMRQNLACIFKEGMNNILKHHRAACQNVKFEIMRENGHFVVTLTDDGPGFDLNTCTRGHGLRNMQTRAQVIGGELEISSTPGLGTTIRFTAALRPLPFALKPATFSDWHNGAKMN